MPWSDPTSLRFTEAGAAALILGPVGVGKTHLATALGHIGIRRRLSVHLARADTPRAPTGPLDPDPRPQVRTGTTTHHLRNYVSAGLGNYVSVHTGSGSPAT
jgi:energy-coupling factor transporter ATP-binding protein EcfA2